jgi:hypothetical protein
MANGKQIVLAGAVAALCLIGGWIAGFYVGNSRYITSQKGAFVLSLEALEDLRNGKDKSAIQSLESFCYSSALVVLRTSANTNDAIHSLFLPKLITYREMHGGQQSSPVELELDELLGINIEK